MLGEADGDRFITSNACAEVDSNFVDTLSKGDFSLSDADMDEVFWTGIRVGTWGSGGPSIVFVTVSKGLDSGCCGDFNGLFVKFFVRGVLCGVTERLSSIFLDGVLSGDSRTDFLGVELCNILLSTVLLDVLFSASGT